MIKPKISIGGREMKFIRSVYPENGNTSLQLVDKETGLPEAMLSLLCAEVICRVWCCGFVLVFVFVVFVC